eukprot:CAMPEP_0172764830 /NCGR_PEP_ID=MMETSP1074-20121228/178016_1 /TAXON_ID=2916 /ORGANISM="Ceratium fusus, Strain PA161109" /LENGTH=87 /DNA_ID=CAMNT_0013599667 /DNA_START=388 /DNA_END=651 /DNA_ORIENTATION=+
MAMFHTILKLAFVHGSVGPGTAPKAVSHVILPWTEVNAAIGIVEGTQPMSFASAKLATINASIREDLGALTVRLIIKPLTSIFDASC